MTNVELDHQVNIDTLIACVLALHVPTCSPNCLQAWPSKSRLLQG